MAQIGAREHYAAARALVRDGQLTRLYTDVWCSSSRQFLLRGPALVRSVANRFHPELPNEKVTAFTATALRRQIGSRLCRTQGKYLGFLADGQWFGRKVVRALEQEGLNPPGTAFFGYNTGCLEPIEFLGARGVPCIVDQIDPAMVEEKIVLEERQRWPDWEKDTDRIPEEYYARLSSEWKLADAVIVNSDWSKRALEQQGVPTEKLHVVPLSFEPEAGDVPAERTQTGPLRVLWAGTVNLRKGFPYFLEAAQLLASKGFEFFVAGPINLTDRALKTIPPNVHFLGRVTRESMARIYAKSDIYVLPTLSDGFGLTQLEAMHQGLPVITTPNCGAAVRHGIDGFIVPARDANSLAQRLEWFAGNRKALREMSEQARLRARQFGLSVYAENLNGVLETVRQQRPGPIGR